MGLQELIGKYSGYFIVNYDDFEVVYTEGYENENKIWCYKISDLHKKPEITNGLKNIEQSVQENSENIVEQQNVENFQENQEQVENSEQLAQ